MQALHHQNWTLSDQMIRILNNETVQSFFCEQKTSSNLWILLFKKQIHNGINSHTMLVSTSQTIWTYKNQQNKNWTRMQSVYFYFLFFLRLWTYSSQTFVITIKKHSHLKVHSLMWSCKSQFVIIVYIWTTTTTKKCDLIQWKLCWCAIFHLFFLVFIFKRIFLSIKGKWNRFLY